MSTQGYTMSTLEQDDLQILHARQTASIVMNGPDDDEDINPFEDDDDDFAEEDDFGNEDAEVEEKEEVEEEDDDDLEDEEEESEPKENVDGGDDVVSVGERGVGVGDRGGRGEEVARPFVDPGRSSVARPRQRRTHRDVIEAVHGGVAASGDRPPEAVARGRAEEDLGGR